MPAWPSLAKPLSETSPLDSPGATSGKPALPHKLKSAATAAAVAALLVVYWLAWRAPAVGTFHDDAVYLVTAKALAEGRGYRIISLPGDPPQTKYPILFPLALAAVWKIDPNFPRNAVLLKLAPLSFLLLWLAVTYRWLREEGAGRHEATAVVLLTASSGWVIYLGTALLSETMFAACATSSLWMLSRAQRNPRSLGALIGASLLAAAAFHTRTIGIALALAGPAFLLLRRRFGQALVSASIVFVLCLPWLLWIVGQQGAGDPFYSANNYAGWNILFHFTPAQKLHILAQNIYMSLLSPALLAGLPVSGMWALPAAACGLWILISARRLRLSAAAVAVAAYCGVVLCWAWPPPRFLALLLPLFYWCAWRSLSYRNRLVRRAAVAAAAVAAGASLLSSATQIVRLGDPLPTLAVGDGWREMEQLLAWVREHVPADAILAGNIPPLYYLYTGRKAIRGFRADPYDLIYAQKAEPLGKPEQIRATLQAEGASFWVRSPNSAFLEGPHLVRVQEILATAMPRAVTPLYSRGLHVLYRLNGDASPTGAP